jgi:hypothetical protein
MRCYVWVIEAREGFQYRPCTNAKLYKRDALVAIRKWRKDNPDDKFRLVRYYRHLADDK